MRAFISLPLASITSGTAMPRRLHEMPCWAHAHLTHFINGKFISVLHTLHQKHCPYTFSEADKNMVAHDDPRLAKVGFAKLVGSGLELYTKKHEITLGRLSKSGHVDVVLGKGRCMCLLSSHLPCLSHGGLAPLLSLDTLLLNSCFHLQERT